MRKILIVALLSLLYAGCAQSPLEYKSDNDAQRTALISDGAMDPLDGNDYFFFLPPIGEKKAGRSGTFDPNLLPVVEVRELLGKPGALTIGKEIVFTTAGTDLLVCDRENKHYQFNWKTRKLKLNPNDYYRIVILVGGKELGFADIDVSNSRKEARSIKSGEYIPLQYGTTLPIKFRINQGALGFVGTQGGKVIAAAGAAILDVPQGALSMPTTITAVPLSAPAGMGLVAVYDMSPDGLQFAVPAALTLSYTHAAIPTGISESSLVMLDEVNGMWVELGGVVDPVKNTVTAAITHFSKKAVGVKVASIAITPFGGRIPKGTTLQFSAATLDNAGNVLAGHAIGWSTGDRKIADVDNNGLVSGLGLGVIDISAKSGSISASVTITVVKPVPAGLFAWYTGDNTANDGIGTNNATWRGLPTFEPGKIDQAFSFGYSLAADESISASRYLYIPSSPSFNFPGTGQFSFSFWMNPENTTWNYKALVVKGGHEWNWGIWQHGDQLLVGKNCVNHMTSSVLQAGVWSHVTVTYNNGVYSVYVNGTPVALDPVSEVMVDQSDIGISIGARYPMNGWDSEDAYYSGLMDDIMFFSRELTPTEAADLAM